MSAYWLDLKWPLFIGVWAFSDTWIRAANAEARVALLEARLAEVDGQLSTEEKRLRPMHQSLLGARRDADPETPLESEIFKSLNQLSRMRMTIAGMALPTPGEPVASVAADAPRPRVDEPDRPPDNK